MIPRLPRGNGARFWATFIAIGTVGLVVRAAGALRPGERLAGLTMVVAIIWGAAPFLLDTALGRPGRQWTGLRRGASGVITTVVRLGQTSLEVARSAIEVAAGQGPTIVVSENQPEAADLLADIAVTVVASFDSVSQLAEESFDSNAVVIVGSDCVPVLSACRSVASGMGEDAAWVTGRARGVTAEGFAPGKREHLGGSRRGSARRAGLVLWEPNATLVSTRLLAEHPIGADEELGDWLRKVAAEGHRGSDEQLTLSLTWVPGTPEAYWPSTVRHQRAAVRDVRRALRTGPIRGRALGAGLLMRELYAFPLLFWMTLPATVFWSGGFPLDVRPALFLGWCGLLGAGRWATSRRLHGVPLEPMDDSLDATYGATGSVLALGPPIVGRMAERVLGRPGARPLVWAALVFATAAIVALMGSQNSRGVDHLTASLAVANLLVLWLFGLRALAQRRWDRQLPRFSLDLRAVVGGHVGRVIDGSPSGAAVRGPFEDLLVGSNVAVTIGTAPHEIECTALVLRAQTAAGGAVTVGLSLSLDAADRAEWGSQLVRSAMEDCVSAVESPAVAERRRLRPGRPSENGRVSAGQGSRILPFAVVAVLFSVTVLPVVVIVAGYHPLVMRSGSMEPGLGVGDVVLVEYVWAEEIRPGEVVTFIDPSGGLGTITHRVKSVTEIDGELLFETCGDANPECESWSTSPHSKLGRAVWSMPKLGRPALEIMNFLAGN